MQKEIVIVEDNETMRLAMCETLRRDGYLIKDFSNPEDAVKHFKEFKNPLVISDLRMENLNGIEVLKKVKEINPHSEVIIVSAYGSIDTAVDAMHSGAADFITKPFSNEELRVRVKKIFEKIDQTLKLDKLEQHNTYLNEELSEAYPEIIGQSEKMKEVFSLIEKVAAGDSTILIEGESGTGKELVARAIHKQSDRMKNPFVRVNCGALNDNLLESELFGHEKGSFTGALKQRKGRFELAENGTLFLDEIGDISSAMQVKLLRVIQEKEFERVGGEDTLKSNVRVISATNKDLFKSIEENGFREDLYYRLSVIPIKLPALRERKDDIKLLVQHFLKKLSNNKHNYKMDSQTVDALTKYSWPGNIRELENLIERICVISDNDSISLETVVRALGNNPTSITSNLDGLPLDDALASFEKNLLKHAMKQANGIKNRAAKLLGIRTSTLYYKLEKYGLI